MTFRTPQACSWRALIYYGFPAATVAALVATVWVSNVPPNLWIIAGRPAEAIIVVYVVVLGACVVKQDTPTLHHIGASLGVLTMLGRAGGFMELVLDGQTYLLAAVLERVALAVAVVLWHMYMSYRAGLAQQRKLA